MGLAASQARLLMLTSRKSDIEAKLMQVANQKLALSRDSANLSSDYTSALNTKKLTWAVDNGTKSLTYDLLMRPNLDNDTGQYIITNATNGRVILDDKYISTLGLSKLGNEGSLVSSISKASFLQALLGCTADSANAYIADSKTATATAKTFTTQYNDANIISDSGLLTTYSNKSISVGSATNLDSTIRSISSSMGSQLENNLLTYLGSSYQSKLSDALDYAYRATYNKFACNINDTDSTNGVTLSGSLALSSGGSANTNRLTSDMNVDGGQLINTFLSYFDLYCAQNYGGTSQSAVGNNSTVRTITGSGGTGTKTTDFVADTTSSTATTVDINNNNMSDIYEASYYLKLYDAINSAGWQSGSNVDDKSYLETQVLQGNIAIKQKQTDGTWLKTSTSDSDCPLQSESDSEAITIAEAQYTASKDLLSSKEQKLDLTTKRLDTEHSAITTEVESIQSVIKKNIERSFKIFNA